jgi:DNA-binding beta-propeller fold protein YncE
MKKTAIILILLVICKPVFSQSVSTLAKIEPDFGDGMIVTPEGDILVSGGYNKTKILKIAKEGLVSTFIDGLPGPVGMGFDSKGNLYVANYTGNTISKITPTKEISYFAINLDGPAGLIVNDSDEILITLYGTNFSGTGGEILKFKPDGSFMEITSENGLQDAIGIVLDDNKTIYATNFVGGNLFKVNIFNQIETVATIPNAKINQITYFNNYIYLPSPNLRKIFRFNISNETIEHFAGTGADTIIDGPLLTSGFNMPNSCAIDVSRRILYILEHKKGLIRKIKL